ncbi:MAG: hypothetical protein IKJ99_02960 [Oscillospiraceae bacterium]|nr:hypothetical protein [Oscillospiraceae bacterium]
MAKNRFKHSDIPYAQRLLMNKFRTIAEHRDHAALTALKIATVALNDTEGMGYMRLARFAKHQQELTEEYYEDPEYMEEKLNQRLEQMGFRVVNGRLFGAIDENGNTVSTKNLDESTLPKEQRNLALECVVVDKETFDAAEAEDADSVTGRRVVITSKK